ncbi:hypothetical protein AB0958_18350 [Streptomyces sp. NPDC006655]|uniref:hypothetical protein n=1 Tax=Streptomyces sp. NPDC006655 TaxID=3156898 RepID=UPI0034560DD0
MTALLLAATGCSTGSTGTPGAPGSAADTTVTDPGPVAVEYTTAVFASQFDRASSFVLPRERGVLKVLFAGMTSSSVRAQNLGIGSVHTKKSSGTVVLTGKMCSSGVTPKTATISPHKNEKCVENHSHDSSDPAFKVAVCRASGKWYVCFPKFDEAVGKGSASTSTSSAAPQPSPSR